MFVLTKLRSLNSFWPSLMSKERINMKNLSKHAKVEDTKARSYMWVMIIN